MDEGTRMALINQIGYSMGDFGESARLGAWQDARRHLNKVVAGIGLLAVDVEEHDPSGEGN